MTHKELLDTIAELLFLNSTLEAGEDEAMLKLDSVKSIEDGIVITDNEGTARKLTINPYTPHWEKFTTDNLKSCTATAAELDRLVDGTLKDENGEVISIADYLSENALDIEYRVDSYHTYHSAKVFLTVGGPTVWVDTAAQEVFLRWGQSMVSQPIKWTTAETIDAELYELWEATK